MHTHPCSCTRLLSFIGRLSYDKLAGESKLIHKWLLLEPNDNVAHEGMTLYTLEVSYETQGHAGRRSYPLRQFRPWWWWTFWIGHQKVWRSLGGSGWRERQHYITPVDGIISPYFATYFILSTLGTKHTDFALALPFSDPRSINSTQVCEWNNRGQLLRP